MSDVSVVIPCYLHSRFVLEAVDSCIAQSDPPENIFVILMDENSYALQPALLARSNRVQCILQPRLDLPVARNLGFSKARATFVIPLDADDTLPPNFIQHTLQYSNMADIVYVGFKTFGDSVRIHEAPAVITRKEFGNHPNFSSPSALIRLDAWEAAGGYNEEFIHGNECWEFWLRLFNLHKIFVKCPSVYTNYRMHAAGIRNKQATTKEHIIRKQLRELYPDIFRTLEQHDINIKQREDYTKRYE